MMPRFSFELLIFSYIACLALLPATALAQAGYEVVNATVTPDYGYIDFVYSAQLSVTDQNVGDIAVSKYRAELNIYNGSEKVYSERSIDSKIKAGTSLSDPFVFGPYDFEADFGVSENPDASFEFIFYKNGLPITSMRRAGPAVEPPRMTGVPQFDDSPYFVEGLQVSGSFRDMEGLSPTCALEITGPMGGAGERTWTTPPFGCESGGRNIYEFAASQDLSSFRDGGAFNFNIIYNNARIDPLRGGPYNFTVRPYSPAISAFDVPAQIDYTNFTILAEIEDVGMKVTRGGRLQGCHADLVITRPDNTTLRSEIGGGSTKGVKIDGDYLIFDWDRDLLPLNRTDVDLSMKAPFSARIEYWNDQWSYGTNATASFRVVEEIPRLMSFDYDPVVYVRKGEETPIDISAVVGYSKGMGNLTLSIMGPGMNYVETAQGSRLGTGSYSYRWKAAFDEGDANNNYTLTLIYSHPSIEGGSYGFQDRAIQVVPVSVVFENGAVGPSSGQCDDVFNYSVKVNSSVRLDLALQVYNPCTSEWESRSSWTKSVSPGSSIMTWSINPFDYDCPEMADNPAKFRFKARFGKDEFSSRAYSGPMIGSAEPQISLDYDPVVYVPSGSTVESIVRATVRYPPGMGSLRLSLKGPGVNLDETSEGVDTGDGRYDYDYTLPFNESHTNSNYTLGLTYSHSSLGGGSFAFTEKEVRVVPVYISFENASVAPTEDKNLFRYSVDVNSSVPMDIVLQTYDPCREVWDDRDSHMSSLGKVSAQWTVAPFERTCEGMDRTQARYRFIGRFGDLEYTSEVYPGPKVYDGEVPELISLDYTPVIYVSDGSKEYQKIEATVRYSPGMGVLAIAIRGPGMDYENENEGIDLGGGRYTYKWSVPFGAENAGNHTISLRYIHESLEGGAHAFDDAYMSVEKTRARDTGTGQSGSVISHAKSDIHVVSRVTQPIGVVDPDGELGNRGILKVSDSETLYPFKYTARLESLSGDSMPWAELLVKVNNSAWKTVGDKKQYDAEMGMVSWVIDPFLGLEFSLGDTAQYKFLLDGKESDVFRGPEIIAIYRDQEWNASGIKGRFDYSAWFNSSVNLTIDLLNSKDNKRWTPVNQPQEYVAGSGWVKLVWKNLPGYNFYDMDIRARDSEEAMP